MRLATELKSFSANVVSNCLMLSVKSVNARFELSELTRSCVFRQLIFAVLVHSSLALWRFSISARMPSSSLKPTRDLSISTFSDK